MTWFGHGTWARSLTCRSTDLDLGYALVYSSRVSCCEGGRFTNGWAITNGGSDLLTNLGVFGRFRVVGSLG